MAPARANRGDPGRAGRGRARALALVREPDSPPRRRRRRRVARRRPRRRRPRRAHPLRPRPRRQRGHHRSASPGAGVERRGPRSRAPAARVREGHVAVGEEPRHGGGARDGEPGGALLRADASHAARCRAARPLRKSGPRRPLRARARRPRRAGGAPDHELRGGHDRARGRAGRHAREAARRPLVLAAARDRPRLGPADDGPARLRAAREPVPPRAPPLPGRGRRARPPCARAPPAAAVRGPRPRALSLVVRRAPDARARRQPHGEHLRGARRPRRAAGLAGRVPHPRHPGGQLLRHQRPRHGSATVPRARARPAVPRPAGRRRRVRSAELRAGVGRLPVLRPRRLGFGRAHRAVVGSATRPRPSRWPSRAPAQRSRTSPSTRSSSAG